MQSYQNECMHSCVPYSMAQPVERKFSTVAEVRWRAGHERIFSKGTIAY